MIRYPVVFVSGFLITAVAASAAIAQDGGGLDGVDASLLQEGTDSLAIFLIQNDDTIRTGTVRDELRVVGSGREARLIRVYRSHDEILGSRLDTITNAYPSLRPLSERSRTSRNAESLDFSPGEVTGSLRLTNGNSVAVRASLPETVFGAASFDLVLRSAPLSGDWAANVPSFLSATRTVVSLSARVTGSEHVRGEECWRIEADFAGTPVTFWVERETRRLCQQVMQLRPGVAILFGPFPAPTPPRQPAALKGAHPCTSGRGEVHLLAARSRSAGYGC